MNLDVSLCNVEYDYKVQPSTLSADKIKKCRANFTIYFQPMHETIIHSADIFVSVLHVLPILHQRGNVDMFITLVNEQNRIFSTPSSTKLIRRLTFLFQTSRLLQTLCNLCLPKKVTQLSLALIKCACLN